MNYNRIKKISEQLLLHIENSNISNNDPNMKLLKKNLNNIILAISDEENLQNRRNNIKNICNILFTEQKDIGIKSFYIWKEEYDERVKINEEIKKLVLELEKLTKI